MTYDTQLFIEIIESVQDVILLRQEYTNGFHIHYYQGRGGRLCVIDTTDEFITEMTAKAHLHELGLQDLVSDLFPEM